MPNTSRRRLLSGALTAGCAASVTARSQVSTAKTPSGPVVPAAMTSFYEHYHFAPGFVSSNVMYLSGQIGLDADLSVPDDPTAQARLAFENLGVVLKSAGLDFHHIVSLTTHHVGDVSKIFEWFGPIKDSFIGPPYPAWTAVGVTGLAAPKAVIEIAAIARAS